MKKKDKTKYRNLLFVRYTAMYLIAVSITSYFLIQYTSTSLTDIYTKKNEDAGRILRYEVITDVSELLSDIHFLSQQVEHFKNYEDDYKRHLKETFTLFSKAKMYFDQIRMIDEYGNEIVRVNKRGQESVLIPDSLLQFKGDRYYFTQAIDLNKNEVFWSLFDLNIEHGEIELPYKPTIRIAQPVFDKNGHKFGVVVLNYLGKYIIDLINNNSYEITGNILFVNHKGYYYKGFKEEDEWGFMFKDKTDRTFANDFPEEWKAINNGDADGELRSSKGIFTYFTFSPAIRKKMDNSSTQDTKICMMETCNWRIITFLPKSVLNQIILHELKPWIYIGTGFSFIMIYILWILATRTHQRKIQQELILSKNNLLNKQNQELSTINTTKDKLFSIIAHDLRNPFGSFKSIIDLMVDMNETLERHEVYDLLLTIQESADNTYKLLENLLMWSRSQQNRITLNIKSLDLGEIISRNIKLFTPVAEKKKITLKSSGKIHFQVMADENLLDTVIRNLVSNAIKFTPEEGEVKVSAGELNDTVTVKVHDSGVGMSEEIQKGLFGLSTGRSTRGTNNEEGTGLGLIICKEFVEKNGGEISVYSKQGEGSTFAFTVKKA